MRNIASYGHFSDSLEVFNSPQTDGKDGGDNERQRDPGKYLTIISLKQVNWAVAENIEKYPLFSVIIPKFVPLITEIRIIFNLIFPWKKKSYIFIISWIILE